jgi:hypothetical protein
MRPFAMLTLFLTTANTAGAQRVIDITHTDADVLRNERVQGLTGGSIFPPDKYIKVKEGSPYYWDDWATGTLVLDGGTAYQNLQLKLDLLNHEVHYKDASDREMILTAPLREIVLRPGLDARYFILGKAWADVDKRLADSWLQVLVNDKVSLMLDVRKKLVETTSYASSTAEQTIEEKNVYFVQKGGQFLKVTKWSELLDILGDKRNEVARYVKEKDLTGEAPVEYADLVAYYNTL